MNGKINSENYEAFYLDFLEGNLSTEEAALFSDFLNAHPELKLEDESLVYVPASNSEVLEASWKTNLKINAFEDPITLHNIELFLIASVENQLSESKKKELNVFLAANPSYQTELGLYQRSKLQADLTQIYANKNGLKKGGGVIIPMFVRYAAVAASIVLVVSIYLNNDQPTKTQLSENQKKESRTENSKGDKKTIENREINSESAQSNPTNTIFVASFSTPEKLPIVDTRESIHAKIPMKNYPKLKKPLLEHTLAETSVNMALEKYNIDEPVAYVTIDDMKNPIKPITTKLGEVLKQEVDFRTSKAARRTEGGFYIKIGKLEISRKVYDKSAVAKN